MINDKKWPNESAAFPQHLNRSTASLTSALFCSFCFLWERSPDPWRQCETELYRKRILSKLHLISYRKSFAVWTRANSSCSAFRNHKINIRKAAEGVRRQMFVALRMVEHSKKMSSMEYRIPDWLMPSLILDFSASRTVWAICFCSLCYTV